MTKKRPSWQHVTDKLSKIKHKKNFKSAKEKCRHFQGNTLEILLPPNFPQQEGMEKYKVLKEKTYKPRTQENQEY